MSDTHQGSKTIWKFPLVEWDQAVEMPQSARILHVENDRGSPTMWALVDPAAPLVKRRFLVVGTGWSFDDTDCTYLGTATKVNDWMVFHVFERPADV